MDIQSEVDRGTTLRFKVNLDERKKGRR